MASKNQGTRLYYATEETAWVDLAAGAAPGGSFTQITAVQSISFTPHNATEFDDSDLEDTEKEPLVTLEPGTLTFTRKRDALSATLRGFCDGSTKKRFVVLYLDGSADYCDGLLVCNDGGAASRGDFNTKVMETYRVIPEEKMTYASVAS